MVDFHLCKWLKDAAPLPITFCVGKTAVSRLTMAPS